MKWVLLVAALCSLAGCALKTSSSSTMPAGGGGAQTAGDGGGPDGGGEEAGEETYDANEGDLSGMTIESARQAIEDKGFTGTVEVSELYEYDKDCKAGTVCRFEPRRWYLNQDRRVVLLVNRTLTLSAPE